MINIHLTNVEKIAGVDAAANEYFIDVIGNKTDASDDTAGTASTVALLRHIIANLSTDADVAALLGALDSAAASGAVTDSDVMMAYIKQLVTEGIARDSAIGVIDVFHDVAVADAVTNAVMSDIVGNKTDAAAAGAVSAVESLMAYCKQLVTEGIARDAVITTIDAFHDVPVADVVDNVVMSDVLGNKEDAAATGAITTTESIAAYIKQLVTEGIARDSAITIIDGLLDVPSEDLATDDTINQVVGKKSDTVAGTSLVAITKQNAAALVVVDALFNVPTEDLATDDTINQVVGKKSDTVAGTSLISITKQNAAAIVVMDAIGDETNGYLESGGDIHDVLYADAAGASIAVDIAENQTDLDTLIATNGSADSSGTFSYLDAGSEQDVVELTNSTRKTIIAIWVDAINLTNNGTFKVYYKVDGTNYRELVANADTITSGTDEAINLITGTLAITEDLKITYEEASDEGAARDIPFSVIYETKE